MQDISYAARLLRKTPGFTILVVLILALGIGANTAVFSVVNSVLLKPLPYPGADRLMLLWETNPRLGVEREGPSGPNYLDWKEQNQSFEDMALLEIGTGVLTGVGEPEQFPGARVSTNFLTILGARAALGRTFTGADGQGAERHNVAVLSNGFWKRRFGGDPSVIGTSITINHQPYTVIGVLDPRAWSPFRADAYVPWPDGELRSRRRDNRDFGVIARLKPGVSVGQAQADMDNVARRTARMYPGEAGWGVTVVPFQKALVEYIRPALLMLLASVAFVLLLACANVANLLLARIMGRQRETGVRAAMGAGPGRLIRQFLTENLMLSLMGGAAGLLVAVWGVEMLQAALPKTIPLPNAAAEVIVPAVTIDGRVLLFTLGISFVCAIIFGLFPAMQASRVDLNTALKEGTRSSTGSRAHNRVRRALVVSETALAFLLLMGASLALRSFLNLQQVNTGIRPDHVLTFRLRLPTDSLYTQPRQQAEFFREVLERVRAIPGVQSAGVTDTIPLGQENSRQSFHFPDRPSGPNSDLMADARRVSPGYFETLGISLLQGRFFTDHDNAQAPDVVIVDESFARHYFTNENPLGKRIGLGRSTWEIVGVVSAVRHYGLDKPPRPTIYTPYLQWPRDRMALAVRTTMDSRGMIDAVKNAVWAVDKDQPVFQIRSMNEYVSLASSAPRIALMLLAVFAGIALVLAALGIYGVVSYTVSQRTHEFGLRMALGANPAQVRRLVLRHGLLSATAGIALGLAGTLLLTPGLRPILYDISPADPIAIATTATVLLLVTLVANYIPARRATLVDPLEALRYE
jgi:putative ABC transport system permease protein